MSAIAKIKKDDLGLYVNAGGCITRPFFGTMFKEGDEVKTHHFGGSIRAGVTFQDKNFTHKNREYEIWCVTEITIDRYSKMSKEELSERTKWSKAFCERTTPQVFERHNKEFKEEFKSKIT